MELFGIFAIGVVSGISASGVLWILGLLISGGINAVFKNNF